MSKKTWEKTLTDSKETHYIHVFDPVSEQSEKLITLDDVTLEETYHQAYEYAELIQQYHNTDDLPVVIVENKCDYHGCGNPIIYIGHIFTVGAVEYCSTQSPCPKWLNFIS